jgi:SAM-dependent methyltransferase
LTFSDSGKFLCNICGTECERPVEGLAREGSGCSVCHSSMRVRALIAVLSEELLGIPMPLSEFPVLKGIRGIGMTDSPELAEKLEQKLAYTNTFFHQTPRLDITRPDPSDFGLYDFILTSEVMEHVPPPVENAFQNLFRLLKPDGLLVMTTPYTLGGKTEEHFPELHDFTLASLHDKTVLVNRRRDGSIEIFEDMLFHGGDGSTVEMRVFTEGSLRENLLGAGFSSVRVASEDVPEFGIKHNEDWSLPIVARKGQYRPPAEELAREYRVALSTTAQLREQLTKLEGEYDSFVDHHRTSYAEANRLLAERYEWGMSIERERIGVENELAKRTEWAQGLDREITELRQRLEALHPLYHSWWTKLGRKLGIVE